MVVVSRESSIVSREFKISVGVIPRGRPGYFSIVSRAVGIIAKRNLADAGTVG